MASARSHSLEERAIQEKLRRARVARLATVDRRGRPHIVPVCFAASHRALYTALDLKPKRAAPERLARVRNIQRNADVALLVDHYNEDWAKLWYILIRGKASLLSARNRKERKRACALLKKKYAQYASGLLLPEGAPVIRIIPTRLIAWGKI